MEPILKWKLVQYLKQTTQECQSWPRKNSSAMCYKQFEAQIVCLWMSQCMYVCTRVEIRIPKYRKYRKIPKFNSIEYQKFSIPKFQYYWIPKKIQYWSSIVPKFSVLLYRKYLNVLHFQQKSQKKFVFPKCPKFFLNFFSIFGICSVFFGINTENTKFLDKN